MIKNSFRHYRIFPIIKFLFYFTKNIFSNKRRISFDFCNCCQRRSIFLFIKLKLQDPRGISSYDETGFCFFCGSQNRTRAMVNYLENYNLAAKDKIYLPAGSGPLFNYLKKNFNNKNLFFSDYYDDVSHQKPLIPHMDLMDQNFVDNAFDIILSEHVMEHVGDPHKAFKEICRILKPGGKFIFSIPLQAKNHSVMRVTPDGKKLLKKFYHLDPLRKKGVLVYTDFSLNDLESKYIKKSGFRKFKIINSSNHSKDGIFSTFFEATK